MTLRLVNAGTVADKQALEGRIPPPEVTFMFGPSSFLSFHVAMTKGRKPEGSPTSENLCSEHVEMWNQKAHRGNRAGAEMISLRSHGAEKERNQLSHQPTQAGVEIS